MIREDKNDCYISKIRMPDGKLYRIGTKIEPIAMICKNCGATVVLKDGRGECVYCGTYYITQPYLEEAVNDVCSELKEKEHD